MNTISDAVFGEMNYRHSWKGTCNVPAFGSITVTAQAYPGESISDAQRLAFQTFMGNPNKFISDAETALITYASKIYPGVAISGVRPESILFRQNGIWGFIYQSPVGEDDGLSVRFENGRAIADTDDALF